MNPTMTTTANSRARSGKRASGRRRRSNGRPPTPHPTPKRLALATLKWLAVGGIACAAVAAATLALIFWVYGRDPQLPNIRTAGDYQPKQVTRIAAADGEIIGEIYTERRTFIPYEEIPPLVVHAFVAAEDADFFQHQGLDYWGMLRALYVNLKERQKKQGASTITQQVVKTFFLSPERRIKRKIQEIILARRLEGALSKEEILALYLNQIYFGHGRYGVAEAANYYFGKEVKDLHAGEAAMLGGLPQGPEILSPKKPRNQERAKSRQKYVLEQMAYLGYIEEAEAKKWIDAPIAVVRDPYPEMGTAPEWVDVVRKELVARHDEQAIDTLGAQVMTTLDRTIQRATIDALRSGLRAYDKRKKYGQAVRKVKPDKIGLEVAKLARKLPKTGPGKGNEYFAVVREVHEDNREVVVDLGDWVASVMLSDPASDRDDRYNPADPKTGERKTIAERFAPGDVLRVQIPRPGATAPKNQPKYSQRWIHLARGPEGAVVIIDPRTRRVLAMAGGYDQDVGDFNRVLRARRQPGSTFKPLVYAAAIETGKYTAASIINDAPEVYDLWKPQNYKTNAFEGKVRLRYALAKSINTVSIRVLHDVGAPSVVELARGMGISSKLPAELSLALGSGEVTPLELTNAFATLAAGGTYTPPQLVKEIDGEAVAAPEGVSVLSPQTAYVVVDMMTSVVQGGTASKAKKLGITVAGKTGTSNDARDAWFIGISPSYVVGVWVGFDDNRPLGRKESGGSTALPVYVELMQAIGKKERGRAFAMPEGVSRILVDKATGLLAAEGVADDTVYREVFVTGTEPTESALAPDANAASTFVQDEYEQDLEDDFPTEEKTGSDDE